MTVSARDRDRVAPHNTTRYSLRSDQASARFFLIDEVKGTISLKESILGESAERYEVSAGEIIPAYGLLFCEEKYPHALHQTPL